MQASNLQADVANPELREAWKRLTEFDRAARVRRQGIRVLLWSILLAIGISFIGALSVYLPEQKSLFSFITLVLSLIITGLLNYEKEFQPTPGWVSARIAAEIIRREIYFYRTHSGEYFDLTPEARRKVFNNNLGSKIDDEIKKNAPAEPDFILAFDQSDRIETGNGSDDGYSDLSVDDYLHWVVQPRLDWFAHRARWDETRRRQWWIFAWIFSSFFLRC